MKIFPKISLLFFLILILNNCKQGQKWFKTLKYEGTVFESKNGPPLKGAMVNLLACVDGSAKDNCDFAILGHSATDSLGHFLITIKSARSNRYDVEIDAGAKGSKLVTPGKFITSESELKTRFSEIFWN